MFPWTKPRYSVRGVLLVLGCWLAPGFAAAQGLKLNRTLPRSLYSPVGGDVSSFQLSPDGAWAVYVANEQTDVLELFSARIDGSAPAQRLNAPFTAAQGFGPLGPRFVITPTSDRVLYNADQETDGALELWSAPIDGSSPAVRISTVFAPGTEVLPELVLAPGGERVVYLADTSANDVYDLWSARIDGSQPPVRLDGPGGGLGYYGRVALSPDGVWVVYRDDEASPGVFELWRAPLDGSTPAVRVLPPLAAFADVDSFFEISPDSSRIVYVADAATDAAYELWSVPLDGSAAPVSLCGPLTNGHRAGPFDVASDSSGVTYVLDSAPNHHRELYWVALDGAGARRRLSGTLVAGGSVAEGMLSPDGATAVFVADAEEDDVFQLYSVPVDLGEPRVRLSESPAGDWLAFHFNLEFTPDGARVVYRSNQAAAAHFDLWSVPLDGGSAPLRLALPGQGGDAGIESFQIDPSGGWVLYSFLAPRGYELWSVRPERSAEPRALQRARRQTGGSSAFAATSTRAVFVGDAATDELYELWSRPLDGSARALRLNSPLAADPLVGDVSLALWTPDGKSVVYRADQERDEQHGLYLVRTEESPAPRAVSETGWPLATELSPDGRWLAWRSFQSLFTAPLDGSQPPIEREIADSAGDPRNSPRSALITPDSRRVVFVKGLGYTHGPWIYRLFTTPIDAPGPSLRLSGDDFSDEIVVPRFVLSPDSRHVVYLELADRVASLRCAPLDGSSPSRALHAPLQLGDDIDHAFQLTPDGSQVVFVSDMDRDEVYELYSAPLTRGARRDGTALPVRLNAPLGPAQDVDRAFRISPDGRRVVYVADQDVDDVFELYSVPLRGGAAPVKLSGPMVAGGDVGLGLTGPYLAPLPQFELGADGARVVYRADQDADEVFELFSAPLGGSASPVRLHPALAPASDVALLSARIDPSAASVVFAADLLQDDVLELFAAPIDGSAAPILLGGPFVAGGDLWTQPTLGAWQALEIAPVGGHVVYLADQDADEVVELYAVPLDGSHPATKLNRTPVAGGDVKGQPFLRDETPPPFRIAPDGRSVLYLADQDADEALELYLSLIDVERVRRSGSPRDP